MSKVFHIHIIDLADLCAVPHTRRFCLISSFIGIRGFIVNTKGSSVPIKCVTFLDLLSDFFQKLSTLWSFLIP